MFYIEAVFRDDAGPDWTLLERSNKIHILLFVLNGELTYYLDRSKIALNKGDVLYIPSGTVRSGHSNVNQPHQKFAIFFDVQRFPAPDQLFIDDHYKLIHLNQLEYMKQRLALLMQQWLGKLPHYETICNGVMLELLGLLAREMKHVHVPLKKRLLVNTMQQYILDHYSEQISIEDLAALVDRTPNYAIKIYREVTGHTPIEYLHQIRIQAANDLMLNSSLTIGQIAEKLGYCDQSYFNRVYKKHTGYPPSNYLGRNTKYEQMKPNVKKLNDV